MGRLTHLNGNGDIYFLVDDVRVRIDEIEELRVAEKLKYYEDLEEKERLLVLPCNVEDILYIIEPRFYNYEKHEGVQKGVCKGYELDDRWGWIVKVKLDEGEPHTLYFYNFSKFGETVFLTREEAEAALSNV